MLPAVVGSQLDESLTIPALSEVHAMGKVKSQSKNCSEERPPAVGVVECVDSLPESYGVLMARTVVSPKDGEVPIRLMNLNEEPVTIDVGKTVGLLAPAVGATDVCDYGGSEATQSSEDLDVSFPDHMSSLLDKCHGDLSPLEYQKLSSFLKSYVGIFASPDGKLGRTNLIEHEIETGDSAPIKQRAWRLPFAKRQVAENEVKRMLAEDIIEPAHGPWASPIVLVTKKDGSVRFCVDYRKLNDATRKDAYPLPRITECLDTLAGSKWFCCLHLASGYWQVPMAEKDKPKTAFTVGGGLYQFRVLRFGLCNAPATFERLMELVLSGLQWKQCLVYLNDIIVFGDSFDATLTNLASVFSRLQSAGLTLKPKKCFLFQRSVKFLGHIVSEQGVSCDPDKISAVQNCERPTNKTEARHFLGLASYYRRFIPHFATIAAPLHALTSTHTKFSWSDECEEAFNQLKTLLTTAPVLSFPNPDEGEFILDTDASNVGLGAVLSQLQQGRETVIAYASRSLSATERKYCTTNKELLAVRYFVEYFKPYLYGRKFRLRTDHASLQWLKNFKEVDGMLARWLSVLDTYDFQLIHRRGVDHSNADALSRPPLVKCPRTDCPDCQMIPRTSVQSSLLAPAASDIEMTRNLPKPEDLTKLVDSWSLEQIKDLQGKDPSIAQIICWKQNGPDKPS